MKGTRFVHERAAAVRAAARGWCSAGVIDAETEGRIAVLFPDPRRHPSWVFRVLTFALVTVVVLCVFLAFAVSGRGSVAGLGVLCLAFGGACAAVTEAQEGSPRLARRGGAGATAFWAGTFLIGGTAFLAHRPIGLHESGVVDVALAASALVWGAACFRWGSPAWAVLSSASLFFLLARLPAGRAVWIVLGALLAIAANRVLDEGSWAPSRRVSAAAVQLVALAALYAGVNTWSVEARGIERLRAGVERTPVSAGVLVASALVTALVTAAVLASGIRKRRLHLLDAGIVLTALSLVTLRHYVHVAPVWEILVVAGGACLLLALGLNRWLSRAPAKERGGFTAEPLFADETKARILQVLPVAATLGPPPSAPSAPPDRPFTPGGGSFGGGGAGERF